ncbi:MAG: T9SS type A sorting domain-containing protein [Bacteroidales bacterium]|nr:T9SS type A sorting domain-containing protein [Bacteroidales bacterium]
MKRITLLIVMMAFAFALSAQTEAVFSFNEYLEEEPLNGQHGWYVRPHTAGNGGNPMYTGYIGHFWKGDPAPTLDETMGVFSIASGTGFGDVATHSLDEFNFDFSSGGVIEVECDMYRGLWGHLFGIGFDGNGDGAIVPPFATAPGHYPCEPITPNAESTFPDGGIYMLTTGYRPSDSYFRCGVVLPNNTMACNFQPGTEMDCWYRWKISIDLDANNGAGAVTLYTMSDPNSDEWDPVPECQGVNAGLTPGSGDKSDPATWNGMFMLNSGMGGFDNFNVRHIPGGLAAQFIDFAEITDQLVNSDPITLQATASSGLPVSFEVLQGPATIDGNILTLTGEEGLVRIRAKQMGDGVQWQAAPAVTRSFYVVDPENYTPTITIRRPYEGTKVYMPDFENPIMIVLSAYIEHSDVLKFEEVKCSVDGKQLTLKTDYPDDPSNGYWYTTWTPSGPGTYNMTVRITHTGGKATEASNTFEVTTNYDDITVSALNGEVAVTNQQFTSYGEYPFPTHVNAFNAINLHYIHNCVNGSCKPYDHMSYVRVKNYRGEWVELVRYVTPFGVECDDDVDVSDFTSLLQGLVEFEVYCEMYESTGDGYNPTAIFEYTKGRPDYPYIDMQELWFGSYSFGDYENLCPVPVRTVGFDPCVEKANLRLVTTGHHWSDTDNGAYNTGNAAEFYEATHNIKINGTATYTQHLWENCTPNPAGCQPQNGTWTYPRAGWCPGSIGMVWNYSLDNYLNAGHADILYEFDPTYVDQCHPNYPDCVSGQNSCISCQDLNNPILMVSGKLVTYSHYTDILTDVSEHPEIDKDPFTVTLSPNPVRDQLTITTDYEKGNASVRIINAQGVTVRRFSMNGTATIDMSDLPSGVYIVKVLGGQMLTKKIIKN